MKLGAPLMRALDRRRSSSATAPRSCWAGSAAPVSKAPRRMMGKLGMRPPRRHALIAGAAETGGGALLATGALTPLATTMLTSTMTTAIRKVHWPKGPWVTQGGWEYNAVLIAARDRAGRPRPGAASVDAQAPSRACTASAGRSRRCSAASPARSSRALPRSTSPSPRTSSARPLPAQRGARQRKRMTAMRRGAARCTYAGKPG